MDDLKDTLQGNVEDGKSVFEDFLEPGNGDIPATISLPDAFFNADTRIDDIEDEPVFMDPIKAGMRMIKEKSMGSIFNNQLKKYFDVVSNCRFIYYNLQNGGHKDYRLACGKNSYNADSVMFVLKKKWAHK